jgi:3-hydroxybutyryl-CoA dehydrogenase
VTDIRTVAVVGAGTMGHGIAQVAAQAGCTVRLTDAVPGAAAAGRERIARNLDGAVERGKLAADQRGPVLDRITAADDLLAAVTGADLVIEAVPEKLALKQALFRHLDDTLPAPVLFATNTSALSVAALAAVTARPDRVAGMHFFNPVHVMRLVEVVVHEGTAPTTRDALTTLARAMGKVPIVVRDAPGFASSRLGVTIALEAMRMLEAGVASAADIDTAMTLGYGHPMGPLRLTDLVGLDVRLAIAEHLHATLGGAHYEPPAVLRRLVAEGKLGRKTGEGFYHWTEP